MHPTPIPLPSGVVAPSLDLGAAGASIVVGILGAGAILVWILGQVRSSRRRRWATEVACAVRARDIRRLERLSGSSFILSWGPGLGDVLAEFAGMLTREVESRRQLAERGTLQRSRLEHAPLPTLVIGADGRILTASDEACWLFSMNRKALTGRFVDELVESVEPVPRRYLRFLDAIGGSAEKRILRTRNGESAPLQDREPLTLFALSRSVDGGERADAERVLALLDVSSLGLEPDRLTRATESIERFAGEVAHEFNDRLTAILGLAAGLEERGVDAETRNLGHRIAEEVVHARGMTSQLLAFSRRRIRLPHVTDLGAALEASTPAFERLLGPDVALDVRLPEEPYLVPSTESKVRGVVEHVLRDLLPGLAGGGSVRIEVLGEEPEGSGSPGVRLRVSATAGERVRRIERPHLESAQGILTGGQGRLVVQAQDADGHEVVSVVWPRVQAHAPEPTGGEVRDGATGTGPQTLCVVDDDDAVREIVSATLATAGYRVLCAESGMAALELFRDSEEPIDLVIVDLGMRPMSGSDLVSALAARHGPVNALYMSGSIDHEVFRSGLARPEDFLQKPFRPREILARVKQALAGRRSVPRVLFLEPHGEGQLSSLLERFSLPVARVRDGAAALEHLEREEAQVLVHDSTQLGVPDLEAVRELRRRWPALLVIDVAELGGNERTEPEVRDAASLEDALEDALRRAGLLDARA